MVGEPAGKGTPNPNNNLKLSIDSMSGSWSCGAFNGTGARFGKNLWHNVSVTVAPSGRVGGPRSWLSLDGVMLGSAPKCATGSLQLALSRYIFAMLDDFSVVASHTS